jgi:hypothetical protein
VRLLLPGPVFSSSLLIWRSVPSNEPMPTAPTRPVGAAASTNNGGLVAELPCFVLRGVGFNLARNAARVGSESTSSRE